MKATEADVVWTPGKASVRVERHGSGWRRSSSDRWMPATFLGTYGLRTTGIAPAQAGGKERELLAMFILFNTIVVRDRVPPEAAHKAFCNIDEYRQAISPDTPGADR